jgi:hypothetical protein
LPERGEELSLTKRHVPRAPRSNLTRIAAEDGSIRCQITDPPGQSLRLDRLGVALLLTIHPSSPKASCETLVRLRQRRISIRQSLDQEAQPRSHIAHERHFDRNATTDVRCSPIHLNDPCRLGIEVQIGEVRARHQQHIAAMHRLYCGPAAKQADAARRARMLRGKDVLGAQSLHDRCAQTSRHFGEFLCSAGTPRARQDDRVFGLSQQLDSTL